MAGVIIKQLTEEQIAERGIRKWPVWTKEVSRFSHFYDDAEECLFLEGEVVIESADGDYNIHPGDFVVFEKGLECVWDIRKPVKKHYRFP